MYVRIVEMGLSVWNLNALEKKNWVLKGLRHMFTFLKRLKASQDGCNKQLKLFTRKLCL